MTIRGREYDLLMATIANETMAPSAGLPAVSVPAGLAADGLPVGIELDGPTGSDRRLLAIAELVAEIAGRLGYAVTVTHGGNEARGKITARDGKFDAILCDIRMPSGDGPGLYDWLCEHHPALAGRIGFVTGDTLGPLAGRFLARSGCPMIEKPFTPGDIAAFLDDLTHHAKSAE